MTPKLYMQRVSPPSRAVLMCAKSLDLELDLIEIDVLKMENVTPQFLQINPLHTIPFLDDNGFLLGDSHAIMIYLVEMYGKDRSLYPDDVKKRARINQMLHFDCGTFCKALKNCGKLKIGLYNANLARSERVPVPILLTDDKLIREENLNALIEAFGFLETFLQNSRYIAGDSLSIADLSLITTITNASALVPIDGHKYPRIRAWRKLMEFLPYSDINKSGGEEFKTLIKEMLSK
ncbi:hypothetical protein NQ317_011901 [Molorchus minor]|uniref:Uncharacterized protein n=1 Tax=Molorchus minor TaxID=1323400 RepID=A0ABQ9J239_9CUCU|nr:hypothetical protein NQ317_011901 [Molorchus minor]